MKGQPNLEDILRHAQNFNEKLQESLINFKKLSTMNTSTAILKPLTLLLCAIFISSCSVEDTETASAYMPDNQIISITPQSSWTDEIGTAFLGSYGSKADYANYGTIQITKTIIVIRTKKYNMVIPVNANNVKRYNCHVWVTLASGEILHFHSIFYIMQDGSEEKYVKFEILNSNKQQLYFIGEYKPGFSEPFPDVEPEQPQVPNPEVN